MEAGLIATPMDRAQDNNLVFEPATGHFRQHSHGDQVDRQRDRPHRLQPDAGLALLRQGRLCRSLHPHQRQHRRPPASSNTTTANWHHGWTAGAGFEYRLFRNVSVGAEYSYYQFGTRDYFAAISCCSAPDQPVRMRAGAEVHTAMARMNFYHPDSAAGRTAAAYSSPAFPGRFSSFVNTAATYGSWEGSRGPNVFQPDKGKGYQVYSPLAIGIDYDEPAFKVETRAKGGYVYTAQRTDGQTAYYSGPIDTQTSFNVVMLNFESVRPQFGVAMNLPTGTSYLPNNQRFTRIDPDLAPVGSYGAGFNVNPTAGFVVGIDQNTAVSLSAGYAWQGKFLRESINLNTRGTSARSTSSNTSIRATW